LLNPLPGFTNGLLLNIFRLCAVLTDKNIYLQILTWNALDYPQATLQCLHGYHHKTSSCLCHPGTPRIPPSSALASRVHFLSARQDIVDFQPDSNISMPVHPIIAALSVHSSTGGNTSSMREKPRTSRKALSLLYSVKSARSSGSDSNLHVSRISVCSDTTTDHQRLDLLCGGGRYTFHVHQCKNNA